MTKNADLPAMPHTTWDNEVNEVISQGIGLTKREHFAAMAMQGNMAARTSMWKDCDVGYMAKMAVQMADALLTELERQP